MDLKNFNLAPLYKIDKEWALLTCGKKDNFNMMTISWGGFGTLWHKPIATIYVRPNRYTYDFIENNYYFTLSFYDENYKKDLGFLGSKSGRDIDKISYTKLTPEIIDNGITFKEANLTIVCKKIYFQDLDIQNIQPNIADSFYNSEPVHRMYVGEVIDIIDKRKL